MTSSSAQHPPTSPALHLILYDGVCGLCNGFVQFVLKHDRRRLFHFASLQSAVGEATLQRFGSHSDDLSTVSVVVDYQGPAGQRLTKGRAVLFVMTSLGWPWRAAAWLGVAGDPVLDRLYDLIATHRYRLFGRLERCALPPPVHHDG